MPEDPNVLLREGRHQHVDLMSGVTAHEGAFGTKRRWLGFGAALDGGDGREVMYMNCGVREGGGGCAD